MALLMIGLPLHRKLHLSTFLVASIAVDIEPLVIVLGLAYPLHGYLYTFLLAVPYGVLTGYLLMKLEKLLSALWHKLLLEEESFFLD